MSARLKYRQLSCQDNLDELVELVNAAYRGTSGPGRWTTEAHLVQGDRLQKVDLERQVASGEVVLYAGYLDENPVCCIALKRDDQVTEFGMFAVDPALHGVGIGSSCSIWRNRKHGHTHGCFRCLLLHRMST